jgi:Myb DNA-binding like
VAVTAASSPLSRVRSSVERQSTQVRSTPALEVQQASSQPAVSQNLSEGFLDAEAATDGREVQRIREVSTEEQERGTPQEDDRHLRIEQRHRDRSAESTSRATPVGSIVHQQSPHLPTPSPTQRGLQISEPQQNATITLAKQVPSLKRRRDDAPTSLSDYSHQPGDEEDRTTPGAQAAETTHAHRPAKRPRVEHVASEVVDEALGESNSTAVSETDPARKPRRRKRALTPVGADKALISPTLITMSELTKDLRQGKKSTREQRLQEKDRVAAAQRKAAAQAKAREQAQEFMANPSGGGVVNGVSSPTQQNGAAASTLTVRPPEPAVSPARLAPRVRVVNGQIVQDEDSRIVDRHQAVAATASSSAAMPANAIEEDELSRLVNSGSYMKRERHTKWTAAETERFYTGLRWFGSDFGMIALMFPGRTRRQIKLKFNKEERDPLRPGAVQQAIHEEHCEPDLAKFEEYACLALRDPKQLENDLKEDRQQLEEAQRRETEAMQQAAKEREDQAEREAEASRQKEPAPGSSKKTATSKASKRRAAPDAERDETGEEADVDATAGKRGREKTGKTSAKGKGKAGDRTAKPAATKGKGRSKGKGKEKEFTPNAEEASVAATVDDTVTLEQAQPATSAKKRRAAGPVSTEEVDTQTTTNEVERAAEIQPATVPLKRKGKKGKEEQSATTPAIDEATAQPATANKKGRGQWRGKGKQNERARGPTVQELAAAVENEIQTSAAAATAFKKSRGRPKGKGKQKDSAPAAATEPTALAIENEAEPAPEPATSKPKPRGRPRTKPSQPASQVQRKDPSPIEDSIVVASTSAPAPTKSAARKSASGGVSKPAKAIGRGPGRPRKNPPASTKAEPKGKGKGKGKVDGKPGGKLGGKAKATGKGSIEKGKTKARDRPKVSSAPLMPPVPTTPAETQHMVDALLRAAG